MVRWAGSAAREMFCPACGSVTRPVKDIRGSFVVEILLWMLFILPGIIYSLWRLSTKAWVCRACRQPGVIPLDSPRAKAALSSQGRG